jgi:predicted ferric reductase
MRVTAKTRESVDVISLACEPADGLPLSAPLPGQFIVLRLQPKGEALPLMRSYSLSGAPNAAQYRISIKCEITGAAITYLDRRIEIGDMLELSAPRGSFTLKPGERPLVLASAGIGITPVLAILCTPWPPGVQHGKSGGFIAPATAGTTPLPKNRAACCVSFPWPEPNLVQQADARGSTGDGFR